MKRRTKIVVGVIGVIVVVGLVVAVRASTGRGQGGVETVVVERGTIVDKALAVGRIEPEVEISVKSQLAGVVGERFVEVGEFVRAGEPLLEIKPTPTPQELVEAKRQVELRQIELDNLEREIRRQEDLLAQGLLSQQEYDNVRQRYAAVKLQVQMAAEQLALLEEGKIRTAGDSISTIIRSPIDGFILEKMVDVGDPVVPLTSFQEGTVLLTMAEMKDLLFRGTVDEIDVGRLSEGMPVEIKIGALPQAKVRGVVTQISLKARTEDNSTVFPVEIWLTETGGTVLRAGYSANADIIIDRREDILVIPERVVRFSGDTARVTVLLDDGTEEERIIQTGLSDAINIEVLSGLGEGDRVVEPPPREIS
ncbi:MAG: efflux RND transporter periplasmic adaptor subunit [Gemmatimonadales bacterium]